MAAAVAGSALAATAQMALTAAPSGLGSSGDVLLLGVGERFAPGPVGAAQAAPLNPARIVAGPLTALEPIALEPQVVDAAQVVKAAGLEQLAADSATRTAAKARAAQEARLVGGGSPSSSGSLSAIGGGVQMMVGRISSGFGPRWDAQHKGLDIAAPIGTPIRVPLDGTVINSGPANGFGLWVRVRHTDGTVTVYGHIDRTLVTVGQRVSAGEVIAQVGNRGRSTGPHLHFEVKTPSGSNINPTPWLAQRGIGIT